MTLRTKVAEALDFLDALPSVERRAFLGLFAGARSPWRARSDGGCPMIGKAECEWVDDWRDFYGRKLPAAGLITFEEEGDKIYVHATDLGRAVREAWWDRLNEKAAQP